MPDTPAVIETSALTKRFGDVLAVDQLTLRVERGGVFGLLGPNGSGKTTTIGMLLGLVAPSSGSVRLFGGAHDGVRNADLHRVGAIVETPSFYPYLSGRDNLRYFQGISGRRTPGEIDRLLELVELSSSAGRKFSTYSLGMKQRLGIAYALLGEPDLVFLDEPTNGLDPAGVAEVRSLVKALGEDGRTVVLSSHMLAEVEQVCERVAIISHGRLLAQGLVADLLRSRGVLRLHTTDDEHAMRSLGAHASVDEVHPDADGLMVRTDEESWALTRLLADQGVYVAELSAVQTTLEQYFLEVTGESSVGSTSASASMKAGDTA
ncbi:MAG: ABC transporter ATP-binding protein [Chloroflexota bacterium]